MANVNRWGHQSLIMIGKESGGFGVAQTTPTNKYADMFLCKHSNERVHIPMHTQTLEPQIQTERLGRYKYLTTISGVLNNDYEWLLQAFFMDAASPYVIPTSGATVYSYTLYHAFPSASSNAGSGCRVLGATLQRLVITRRGGYVGFTADFVCKTADWEVSLAGLTLTTITNTTLPTHTPFMFHDATCSVLDAVTGMNNFTLTLEKELLADDSLYQNSQTILNPYAQGIKVTLDAEVHYGSEKDQNAYDNIYSQTIKTNTISLINASKTWAFTIKGQYTNWEMPDIEKGIYTSKFTLDPMGDVSNTAISVAVS